MMKRFPEKSVKPSEMPTAAHFAIRSRGGPLDSNHQRLARILARIDLAVAPPPGPVPVPGPFRRSAAAADRAAVASARIEINDAHRRRLGRLAVPAPAHEEAGKDDAADRQEMDQRRRRARDRELVPGGIAFPERFVGEN